MHKYPLSLLAVLSSLITFSNAWAYALVGEYTDDSGILHVVSIDVGIPQPDDMGPDILFYPCIIYDNGVPTQTVPLGNCESAAEAQKVCRRIGLDYLNDNHEGVVVYPYTDIPTTTTGGGSTGGGGGGAGGKKLEHEGTGPHGDSGGKYYHVIGCPACDAAGDPD